MIFRSLSSIKSSRNLHCRLYRVFSEAVSQTHSSTQDETGQKSEEPARVTMPKIDYHTLPKIPKVHLLHNTFIE